VREGWALNFEPYAKGRFRTHQADAERERRGVWKGCFAAPWDLRNWNKSKAAFMGAACGVSTEARTILFPDHADMPPGCPIIGNITWRGSPYRGIFHMEGCYLGAKPLEFFFPSLAEIRPVQKALRKHFGDLFGSLALLPLVAVQARATRRRVPRLPPAKPPYRGLVPGAGAPIRLLAIGKSTVCGVGLAHGDETVAATAARSLARQTCRPVAWRAHGLVRRDGLATPWPG
jgi:hypothetical protein